LKNKTRERRSVNATTYTANVFNPTVHYVANSPADGRYPPLASEASDVEELGKISFSADYFLKNFITIAISVFGKLRERGSVRHPSLDDQLDPIAIDAIGNTEYFKNS